MNNFNRGHMGKTSKLPACFGKKDVQIITREMLYHGFFLLERYRFKHKLFKGGMSDEIVREVFVRGHAVALLPYDPKLDKVVLIEQLRLPALETSETPWLMELVAGMIEPGESHEDVARREAQEEAGVKIGRCRQILSYLSSPGGTSERLFVLIGEVDARTASGIHGLPEEHEDIRVHVVSREHAYQWVEEGVIDNAATVIALQWLALHYAQLCDEWNK